MNFLFFILGSTSGIFLYIYLPKWMSKIFEKPKIKYAVTVTISYFMHPIEESKKGEFVRMKPIPLRVSAETEQDAIDFANNIVRDNIKVEIDVVEEIV